MTERQVKMLLNEAYKKWELTYDDLWLECVYELRRMLNEKDYTEAKEDE